MGKYFHLWIHFVIYFNNLMPISGGWTIPDKMNAQMLKSSPINEKTNITGFYDLNPPLKAGLLSPLKRWILKTL